MIPYDISLVSTVRVTWYGIVQGSILGLILYAIFISPLFDVENLTCFADDKFPLVWNGNKSELINKNYSLIIQE